MVFRHYDSKTRANCKDFCKEFLQSEIPRLQSAVCSKLEPLAAPGQRSSDPMLAYTPQGYEDLHQGIRILQANLKTAEGQALPQRPDCASWWRRASSRNNRSR